MKRLFVIGAIMAALGFVSGEASAQIRHVPIIGMACLTEQFDVNGDGVLSKIDITLWGEKMIADGCLNQEATGICAQYDQNRDGVVDEADMRVRIDYFMTCTRMVNVVPPRPR